MQHSLYVYTAVQGKLAVDESTQVDLLTEMVSISILQQLSLYVLLYCDIVILHETKLTAVQRRSARASEYWSKPSEWCYARVYSVQCWKVM